MANTERYQELDALRGIAAIMVVLFHFTMGRSEANWGFKLGTTGVDLFFIISGFVIFMSINKASSGIDFVINRASRLYPTYWAAATCTFVIISVATMYSTHSFEGIPLKKYMANLTMFQFYLNISNLDGPYWTLIIEMLFYIIIFIFCQFKSLRHLPHFLLSLSIISAGMALFFNEIYWVQKIFYKFPLLQFVPLFLTGITFYQILALKKKTISNYSVIFICLIGQICLYPNAGAARLYIDHGEYATMLTLYFTLFILFVNHWLTFIANKTTLFLGKISYALYLIHQSISLDYLLPFFTQNLQINFWIASIFCTLPLVVILASLITFYVEIPLGGKMKIALRAAIKRYN